MVAGVSAVSELDDTLVELVVSVLSKRLVGCLLLILEFGLNVRYVGGVHLRVWLADVRLGRIGNLLLLLRVNIADATHATFEAHVVHFVDRLACFLHDSQVPILINS